MLLFTWLSVLCLAGSTNISHVQEQAHVVYFGEITRTGLQVGVSSKKTTNLVSISHLLSDPVQYHRKSISVRGTVTQLELHVDDTGLFIEYVFVLRDGADTLIVFGKHDQTQGGLSFMSDQNVEVTGTFWKDRIENNYHFKNNLEAVTVLPYPPLHPEAT